MYGYNGNQMQNYSCSNGTGSGSKSERRYKSTSGATIVRDASERITSFRYNDLDPFYHFEYGSEGSICSIDRTDGWNWRRVKSNDFNGWVIHNYWDCWKVNDEACAVQVDESGIRATGDNSDQLALPEG
jgi:hypothetical protein